MILENRDIGGVVEEEVRSCNSICSMRMTNVNPVLVAGIHGETAVFVFSMYLLDGS